MAKENEKENGKDVKVTDKRRFVIDETGGVDVRGVECEEDAPGAASQESSGQPGGSEGTGKDGECTPVPIDFSGLILSLSTSVMVHLGEVPDPMTREKKVELLQAKQTIDIIALLEEKTRGNLTRDEEMLMKDILTDLRFRYVEKSRQAESTN